MAIRGNCSVLHCHVLVKEIEDRITGTNIAAECGTT